MTLLAHLLELRRRLFVAALGVVAGTVGGWFIFDIVWAYIQSPVSVIRATKANGNATINFVTISGAFDVRMQVALTIGLVLSSPLWLYEIFAFLVPGLTRSERRYVLGFVLTAIPLFVGGCAAGFFVMPHIVEIMTSFVPAHESSFLDAKSYLDFVLKLVLATGIAFVAPVFLVLLNFVGVISGRSILLAWRWAILSITIFTAIATPPSDVLSMGLLALPMVVLYFAAVGITIWHDRIAARRSATFDAPVAAGA